MTISKTPNILELESHSTDVAPEGDIDLSNIPKCNMTTFIWIDLKFNPNVEGLSFSNYSIIASNLSGENIPDENLTYDIHITDKKLESNMVYL